jgi:hypothetical protein
VRYLIPLQQPPKTVLVHIPTAARASCMLWHAYPPILLTLSPHEQRRERPPLAADSIRRGASNAQSESTQGRWQHRFLCPAKGPFLRPGHASTERGRALESRLRSDPKGLAFTGTSWGAIVERPGTISSSWRWKPMTPNPGSPPAVAEGCICPTVLNRHGRGTRHGEPLFYYDMRCPVHRGKGTENSAEPDHRPSMGWQAR